MENGVAKPHGSSEEENWDAVSDYISKTDLVQLGSYYSYIINSDIKHVMFTLSRYKFASKLFAYKENVKLLELGCQEALGALVFMQNVKLSRYVGVDLDQRAIEWNQKHLPHEFEFICSNFFKCPIIGNGDFNAVVSLDVIEHIPASMEDQYCRLLIDSMSDDGVAVVGTPSIMMSPYASEGSKIAHINLYDQKRLYELMSKYFSNVFIFNMNDEIVNTGFDPMSCYIFAVCCNQR
jgi:cyclopropane fatty-acyl-phospholipid synthase-like methyltransferase